MPYANFARVAVDPQVAQRLETITFPAPSRGIVMDENWSYMQPGGAIIYDNWKPTLRGAAIRGGCVRWAELPETTPVISGFNYQSGNTNQMFVGNASKLYDVTTPTPVLVQGGQGSGNYCASQFANQGGDWLVVVNDNGDPVLRYDGTSWERLIPGYVPPAGKPSTITGPAGSTVEHGGNLVYACKFHNHLFFIEGNSMNMWFLPLNAVGGLLSLLPLSGATTKGGKLLFLAVWSLDAGDGLDDKLLAVTDLGEVIVFHGSDPTDSTNWHQEGRYSIPEPMGMNAHIQMGGDVLIATRSGVVPISAAVNKTPEELELAMITRQIKLMWRNEVIDKSAWPWTMMNWPEYGGIFVTWPGGGPGNQYCAVVNAATGAWARFVGYDATCFVRMRADMFFGTQGGIVMQADRGGYDDGQPYVCTLVGGWEMFQSPSQMITWRQARATFAATPGQPFQPQLSACTDFVVSLPSPPMAGPDPGPEDSWDNGLWGPDMGGPPPPVPTPIERALYAQWDQPVHRTPVIGNTMWVSIGQTGFTHAPVVQVTIAQVGKPDVELIAISATFERGGINV